ncbi:MAG: flippase-like domain-containing protein [Gemmatimonadaceae bacterium]|nr:flippase-like domain-containing protein [Gemmatimonadaceae bacterium]
MKLDWRGALGIALSALLLWWVLHGQVGEVWTVLSSSNPWLWLACATVATAIFPLRARRWQALLAPLAGRIPIRPLWHATAIGMMMNNVFPMRAGEVARAFVLSRERREVPFTAAFASLAVDRLFDGVIVIGLMLLATLDPRFPRDARVVGELGAGDVALTASLFLGAVLVGLYAFVLAPARMLTLAERVGGLASPRLGARLRVLAQGFTGGLGVLRDPRLALEVTWWTLVHWLTNAAAFWLGFAALGIDAPFTTACFVQGIVALGVALPSSPGFFGLFEAAAAVGLKLYGIDPALAVSWGIGFHILSFIPITVFGAWYFTRLDLRLTDLTTSAPAEGAAGGSP